MTGMHPRLRRVVPMVAVVAVAGAVCAAVAIGDQVKNATATNGIGIGGNVKVEAGDVVQIPYWVEQTGPECDATSASPIEATINVAAGVTASPDQLTFTDCGGVSSDQGDPVYTNVQFVSFTLDSGLSDGTQITVPAADAAVQTNSTSFKFTIGEEGGGGDPADTVPPTITYTTSPAANGAGWNNANVTIEWTIVDDVAIDTATVTGCGTFDSTTGKWLDTISAEAVLNLDSTFTGAAPTCSADDTSGNSTSKTVDPQILIDKTAPQVTITGVTDGATYTTGGVSAPGCDTTDALSGVQTAASLSGPTGLNVNGVGVGTVGCAGALDVADNPGNTPGATYTVNYGFSGSAACILQPINCDNTSVFSRGKSVPVKFRLSGDEAIDANSDGISEGFATTGWSVIKSKQSSCVVSSNNTNEEQPAAAVNSAGLRYDAGSDQYVYNADFRQDAVGTCWKMRVGLNDPQTTTFTSAVFRLTK